MDIFSELDTHPSRAKLLELGLVLLAAGAIGAGGAIARGHLRPAVWLASFGVVMFVASMLPVVGRYAYIGWMGFGLALGRVTSPILLFVVYLLFVVPIGVVLRVRGRDAMRRHRDEKAETYWEDYPKADGVSSYLRQS